MNFAVLQIIVLALLAVVGMTIKQLPTFAFRSPGDYLAQMASIHGRYDPVFGAGVVNVLERLQVFQIFTSTWFSIGLIVLVISIVVCTIDRTPRLWRQCSEFRVVQPDPYYDPRLPDRAAIPADAEGGGLTEDAVVAALRAHRLRVRREATATAVYLYGDRHRWTKMATLLTHLGLILFLVAAAVTARLGDEQGLVVPDGTSLTVQPIGTPGLLLVRNFGFSAPGLATGQATDYMTDLAVYRDGTLLARKVIRVNDPLTVGGYTFHQNGFGPAPDLLIRDATGGVLWSGPVALTEAAAGLPFGTLSVPGRDIGLQILLQKLADGTGVVLVLPYRVTGTNPDGTPVTVNLGPIAIARGETRTSDGTDFSVELRGFSSYTLLIAKHDPGQGIAWLAFGSLISGILITFYLPRRRVWARLDRTGSLSLVGRSDRYVDFDREFGRLLDDLVAARQPRAGQVQPGSS